MRLTKYEASENSMFPYKSKDKDLSTELDIIQKLGQLEDIEDELGCDLITLFKALKNGIYYSKTYHCFPTLDVKNKKLIYSWNYYDMSGRDCGSIDFYINDYGKTWALTKEELL